LSDLWTSLREAFATWTGVELRPAMRPLVFRTVQKLARSEGVTSGELVQRASSSERLRQLLIDRVSIGTTWFLREREALVELVDQLRASRAPDREVVIWSVGCSSGEEPYSLAMLLESAGLKAQSLATDVSRRALRKAIEARYRLENVAELPHAWRKRYFEDEDKVSVRITHSIRSQVTFEQHNIASLNVPRGWRRFDAVVCRNVLMYFTKPRAVAIVEHLVRHCRGGGLLLLGASERPLLWPSFDRDGPAGLSPVAEVDDRRRIRRRRTTRHHVLSAAPAPVEAVASPPPLRQRLLEANRLARAGRSEAALEALSEIVAGEPDNAEAQLELALVLKREGRVEEAARALHVADRLGGSGWLASYQLGVCLDEIGEASEAAAAYQRTLDRLARGAPHGRTVDSEELARMAPTVRRLCLAKLARSGAQTG